MALRAKATRQSPRPPRAHEPAAFEAAQVRTVARRRGRIPRSASRTAHAATRPSEA